LLWKGYAAWRLGRPRLSLLCLLGSLRQGLRFAMPYEQGLAQLALGQLGTSAAEPGLLLDRAAARGHLLSAAEIFSRLGATRELAQARSCLDG
jgi:hypothetical protein